MARWLQINGCHIHARRWRCRWGELDIVARCCPRSLEKAIDFSQDNPVESIAADDSLPVLAFVEVKTRSRGSWDAGGLLAIGPKKQAKLLQTAELFLAEHPQFADLPCQFDVAVVSCQKLPLEPNGAIAPPRSRPGSAALPLASVCLGQPVVVEQFELTLQHYIQAAFDSYEAGL